MIVILKFQKCYETNILPVYMQPAHMSSPLLISSQVGTTEFHGTYSQICMHRTAAVFLQKATEENSQAKPLSYTSPFPSHLSNYSFMYSLL